MTTKKRVNLNGRNVADLKSKSVVLREKGVSDIPRWMISIEYEDLFRILYHGYYSPEDIEIEFERIDSAVDN